MLHLQEFFKTGLEAKAMAVALESAGFKKSIGGIPGYVADSTFCSLQSIGDNGTTRHGIVMDLDIPPTELPNDHPVKVLFRQLGEGVVPESFIPDTPPKYSISTYLI